MTSKLSLYNAALTHLGGRKLSSLSENRKSRRVLDSIYDNNFVRRILEKAQWNHAVRSFESTYDPDLDPDFGYDYGHQKPDDWVRTLAVSAEGDFIVPFNDYQDEGGYWFANQDVLYFRIVSSHADYGGDLSNWPESVTEYAELSLAELACKAITDSDEGRAALQKRMQKILREAKSFNAMNEATKFPPRGSWASARYGGRSSYRRRPYGTNS